ncbi:hypothetical protein HKD37_02G004495 [Glycine soja]
MGLSSSFSSRGAPSPSFLSKELSWRRSSFFHGLFPSGWRLLSPLLLCLPLHLHGGKSPLKDLIEAQRSSLHKSSARKLPLSVVERKTREKRKRKKRVEEISQDEKEKVREEERRKILKELRKEKHASYSSHNCCKSLSEELRDYYKGRHRAHLRPHSHRREKERKPQEANINLSYFLGKDNVEANLDWEIRVEQQLKRKSTSKSNGSHSYPKKDQGQGILGVTPSKPKDDKGKTIEKQPLKASMQEKTSSIKCFKCLGRGHITSQCPSKKTMIMRGQDIYSSQDEATTSPSSSERIYPQGEGQPLMVKEECQEVSVSSKRLANKESHFEIKTNIKNASPLRQPPHLLLCKKTLVCIATPLRLEVIPRVKELLDEGLVRKRLNPCALLVPKIGINRHQIPKISVMMNVLSVATLFCKITHAPNNFMIHVHPSLGSFVLIFGFDTNLDFFEPMGQGCDAIQPRKVLDRRLQVDWARDPREGPRVLMNLRVDFEPMGEHRLQASYPRHILGGEAPSSMADSLVNGASPLLFSFEVQRSSLHRSSTSKLPSSGNQSTRASSRCSLNLHKCFCFTFYSIVASSFFSMYLLTCLVLNVFNMIV